MKTIKFTGNTILITGGRVGMGGAGRVAQKAGQKPGGHRWPAEACAGGDLRGDTRHEVDATGYRTCRGHPAFCGAGDRRVSGAELLSACAGGWCRTEVLGAARRPARRRSHCGNELAGADKADGGAVTASGEAASCGDHEEHIGAGVSAAGAEHQLIQRPRRGFTRIPCRCSYQLRATGGGWSWSRHVATDLMSGTAGDAAGQVHRGSDGDFDGQAHAPGRFWWRTRRGCASRPRAGNSMRSSTG